MVHRLRTSLGDGARSRTAGLGQMCPIMSIGSSAPMQAPPLSRPHAEQCTCTCRAGGESRATIRGTFCIPVRGDDRPRYIGTRRHSAQSAGTQNRRTVELTAAYLPGPVIFCDLITLSVELYFCRHPECGPQPPHGKRTTLFIQIHCAGYGRPCSQSRRDT